jgi:hypothetical protein
VFFSTNTHNVAPPSVRFADPTGRDREVGKVPTGVGVQSEDGMALRADVKLIASETFEDGPSPSARIGDQGPLPTEAAVASATLAATE